MYKQIRLPFLLTLLILLLATCRPAPSPPVYISTILYDGFELANRDEAIALLNVGETAVDISGWQLTDDESGTAVFPPDTQLHPNQPLWLAQNGTTFSQRFQHVVDYELTDSHPLIDNLSGSWPTLSDAGDTVQLLDQNGRLIDAVAYKVTTPPAKAWTGPPIQPQFIEEEGVFLTRISLTDTGSAADWGQTAVILQNGRAIASPRRQNTPLTPVSSEQ